MNPFSALNISPDVGRQAFQAFDLYICIGCVLMVP